MTGNTEKQERALRVLDDLINGVMPQELDEDLTKR